jgi:predicted GIY-YIG superfamily endonuclease
MKTYILYTTKGEFYCGKTENINRRMNEHKTRRGWFQFKERYNFRVIFECDGDYEKNIKSFGVEKFIRMIQNNTGLQVSLS